MKTLEIIRESGHKYQKNLWLFLLAYFFVNVNYSLIRAATTTFFFDAYGAKSTPGALFWSVFLLSFSIWALSYFQARSSAQKVFAVASVVSVIFFGIGHFLSPYFAFIWKEIYIVIQIHLLLAFANVLFTKEDYRVLVGPIGAVGSLGGIIGGVLTSYISSNLGGTVNVLGTGMGFILMPAICFLLTDIQTFEKKEHKVPPLSSLKEPKVKQYILLIASIVMLTQFVINVFDFKFNLAFEAAIPDSNERTTYLGHLYSSINVLTLFLMVVIVPYLLTKVSERNYHLFIPLSYLLCLGLILVPGFPLASIALAYAYLKASDYSVFSAGKEILYQPLRPEQKYGAKYLTDMLVYRGSKALIAIVLIYVQSAHILDIMIFGFLILWAIQVLRLFRFRKTSLS